MWSPGDPVVPLDAFARPVHECLHNNRCSAGEWNHDALMAVKHPGIFSDQLVLWLLIFAASSALPRRQNDPSEHRRGRQTLAGSLIQ
jgi:hypothetical protein